MQAIKFPYKSTESSFSAFFTGILKDLTNKREASEWVALLPTKTLITLVVVHAQAIRTRNC